MELSRKRKKIIVFFLTALFVITGLFFYFRFQVLHSHGIFLGTKIFVIKKGDGNVEIANRLKEEGLISGKAYFYYYLRSRQLSEKIFPGEYELSGNLTIPEIAAIITLARDKNVKITFPEGWTTKQMAQRLAVNGFSQDDFLKIASYPADIRSNYDFLRDEEIKTLEGYLFPDTYFFSRDEDANSIIKKMLGIFNTKITPQMKEDALKNGRSLNKIIIMASIIEGEVRSDEDRKVVSGIFWNRLGNGQPLQSCATLAYVTGEKKRQYSEADTRVVSPFNTYLNKGLPPEPISNPGLSAIKAALYPAKTDFNYFLSDPESGKTIFAKTYEEHLANKIKYGL